VAPSAASRAPASGALIGRRPLCRAGGERYAGASSWIAGWLGWQHPNATNASLANAPKPNDSDAIQKNIADEVDIKKLRTLAKALLQVGAGALWEAGASAEG
jgi:hypothetical protein